MAYVGEEQYEEMISALSTFISNVEEQCGVMDAASKDCLDNTDNDPAAVSSATKLGDSITKIRESEETIQAIIADLQEELEAVREAARRAASAE